MKYGRTQKSKFSQFVMYIVEHCGAFKYQMRANDGQAASKALNALHGNLKKWLVVVLFYLPFFILTLIPINIKRFRAMAASTPIDYFDSETFKNHLVLFKLYVTCCMQILKPGS